MQMLRVRLYQSMMGKETEQRHTARKQQVRDALYRNCSLSYLSPVVLNSHVLRQVGTRSQSERIRTYNFSQDRVTDHRTGYSTRDIKVRIL